MSNNANFSNVFINGISLDEIAERDGFPFFVMRLKGHGNYCLFKSEEGVCRRYHPETEKLLEKIISKKAKNQLTFVTLYKICILFLETGRAIQGIQLQG